MSTAVATVPLTQEQFQEAMMARMRGLMGELMPQATLEEITKRGVEEAFFKPRIVKKGSYGNNDEIKQPWINEFLQKEMAAEVKLQVSAWMLANKERVQAEIEKTLSAGIAGCVVSYFAESFRPHMQTLKGELNQRLQKLGQDQIW